MHQGVVGWRGRGRISSYAENFKSEMEAADRQSIVNRNWSQIGPQQGSCFNRLRNVISDLKYHVIFLLPLTMHKAVTLNVIRNNEYMRSCLRLCMIP